MHPNPTFHMRDRAVMRDIVSQIGFGMLFAATPDGLRVAHIPALLDEDRLVFHLARGNALTRHLQGSDALFVCNGPDGYLSPDWYGMDDQVPTWNYLAVELEGSVSRLVDSQLEWLLERVSEDHERRLAPKPAWHHGKMAAGLFENMQRGIVGFAMDIKAWRGTAKLSQNKPEAARMAAANGLESAGRGAIAHLMRNMPR